MSDIIEVPDLKFAQAEDQPNTVRAIHRNLYKVFLHTPSKRCLPVLEFKDCETVQQAKARYVQHIEDGTLEVIDEPNFRPPR